MQINRPFDHKIPRQHHHQMFMQINIEDLRAARLASTHVEHKLIKKHFLLAITRHIFKYSKSTHMCNAADYFNKRQSLHADDKISF